MPTTSSLQRRLAELTLELVSIPSVTGDEQRLADHLERWALGLPNCDRDDVFRHDNALVIGQPSESRPSIALVGHLDTVPPTEDYAGPQRDGDRLVGLGASDMKGGIAVMQALCEYLDLEALPFALVLLLYDREEGSYEDNGLQPLLERFEWIREVDLAVAMEPTDGTLQLGCLGGLHARVTFHGKAAHSARPWQGANAIHAAAPLLTHLAERQVRNVEVEGLVFREALNATLASGGRARNVIPDRFEINLNYRFAPPTAGEDAQTTTARCIEEVRALAGDATVEIVDVAPPGPVPRDNDVLDHLQAVAGLTVAPKQAWTDVARLAAFGIDAVNYGPGMGAQAHQAGEWISLDAVVQSYRVLEKVLTQPLG